MLSQRKIFDKNKLTKERSVRTHRRLATTDMNYRVLVINPGSTSTKIAVFRGQGEAL